VRVKNSCAQDQTQLRWSLYADGANGISLVEAQSNYRRIGAMAHEALERVQSPLPFDLIEEGWRPIDLSRDNVERRTGLPLRARWPNDLTVLYGSNSPGPSAPPPARRLPCG